MNREDDSWLDEVVTEQAKQDPNWREDALTGRGHIQPKPVNDGDSQSSAQEPR